jgi:hypothetical protein
MAQRYGGGSARLPNVHCCPSGHPSPVAEKGQTPYFSLSAWNLRWFSMKVEMK